MLGKTKGFTLIEVMVALAIVAIALATGAQAYSQWIDGSRLLHERALANICIQNAWAKWSLMQSLAPVGEDASACVQDGQTFKVLSKIQATPNARFRKVTLSVYSQLDSQQPLASMVTAIAK